MEAYHPFSPVTEISPDSQKEIYQETLLNSSSTPSDVLVKICHLLDRRSFEALLLTKKGLHPIINSSKSLQRNFLYECAKNHLIQAKEKTLELQLGERFQQFTKIAQAENELDDFKGAKKTLREAVKAALSIEEQEYRSCELLKIAKIQITIGSHTGAKKTLDTALECSQEPSELTEIGKSFKQIGDCKGATKALKLAKKEALNLDSAVSRSQALTELAKVQAEIGEFKKATKILKLAKEIAAGIQTTFNKSLPLGNILKAKIQIGIITKDKEILDQAKELTLLTEFIDPINKVSLLIKIGEAQNQIGASEDAKKTIPLAEEAILPLTAHYDASGILSDIAKAYFGLGDREKADKAILKAKEVISQTSSVYRYELLKKVLKTQVAIDDLKGAQGTLAKEKEGALPRTTAFTKYQELLLIAKIQDEIGDRKGARETFTMAKEEALLQKDTYSASQELLGIIKAQVERDDLEEAMENFLTVKEFDSTDFDTLIQAEIAITKAQIKRADLEKAKESLAQVEKTSLLLGAFSKNRIEQEIVEAQDELRAMEATIHAKRGNSSPVRTYLQEVSEKEKSRYKDDTSKFKTSSSIDNHIAIAQKALELADITLKSPNYAY